MDKKELCKELKKIRTCEESGYTVSLMASVLGVSDKTIQNLESGDSNFKMSLVCAYCDKLCTEIGVRLCGTYYSLCNDLEVIEFIRSYETKTGYKTPKVAEIIGCSERFLYYILAGKVSIKIDMLIHFIEVIGGKLEVWTDLIVE